MAIAPSLPFLPGFRLLDGTVVNAELVDKINALIAEVESDPSGIVAGDVVFATDVGNTATPGGGQTNALQLLGNVATVTTVGTAADSVKLPLGIAGAIFFLANATATSMTVFGAGTDTINGVATATGVAQAANTRAVYFCTSNAPAAAWFRILSA